MFGLMLKENASLTPSLGIANVPSTILCRTGSKNECHSDIWILPQFFLGFSRSIFSHFLIHEVCAEHQKFVGDGNSLLSRYYSYLSSLSLIITNLVLMMKDFLNPEERMLRKRHVGLPLRNMFEIVLLWYRSAVVDLGSV